MGFNLKYLSLLFLITTGFLVFVLSTFKLNSNKERIFFLNNINEEQIIESEDIILEEIKPESNTLIKDTFENNTSTNFEKKIIIVKNGQTFS